jgi:hypothetical protein
MCWTGEGDWLGDPRYFSVGTYGRLAASPKLLLTARHIKKTPGYSRGFPRFVPLTPEKR